jgi:hypothetical protein
MYRRLFLMLLLLTSTSVVLARQAVHADTGRSFFVDCANGIDTRTGLSESLAWKSMSKANGAALVAGDSLLFKRGCTWNVRLTAKWLGTAAAPITIGTYGTDPRPAKIADTGYSGIMVTGKYQVIDGFEVGFKPVATDPCGQPLGQYFALEITQGGAHNTIQHNLLTHATAGLHISKSAGEYNKVYYNTFTDNNVMQVPFNGDLGAWGILVRGSHTDIAYNTFRDNISMCLKDLPYLASNSVEIYEGDFNTVHHNWAENDRVFSELGSSATNKATDNNFSFNEVVSNVDGARFITTRGGLDTTFGPVDRTVVERNTVYFTGVGSQGLICSLGCSSNILTARYNIIQAEQKGVYFDQTMGQVSNLYWSSVGVVKMQDGGGLRTVGPSSTAAIIVADPGFVDPANGNFRLRSSSRAVDAGGATGYWTDLDQAPTPAGARADLGTYELQPPPVPTTTTTTTVPETTTTTTVPETTTTTTTTVPETTTTTTVPETTTTTTTTVPETTTTTIPPTTTTTTTTTIPPTTTTTTTVPANPVSVSSLSPSSLGQGSTWRTVKLNGTGFVAASTVSFSGSGITVKSMSVTSPTQLTLMLSVAPTAGIGDHVATVTSPGHPSANCTACFRATWGPKITSVSPNVISRGRNGVKLVIVGKTFNYGVGVIAAGTGITIVNVSRVDSTRLSVTVNISATAVVGPRIFSVINRDAGKASITTTITV